MFRLATKLAIKPYFWRIGFGYRVGQYCVSSMFGSAKNGFSFIKNMQAEVEIGDEVLHEKTVTTVTAKEMKNKVRPDFEKNPEKYYPVDVFKNFGFSRAQCSCGHFYWRKSEKATCCGDCTCTGKYTFIGKGTGIGREGKKITYSEAWEGFKKSLTSSRIPCTAIDRYPVVARWRNDVDYVAAGIFCFQPYCVTGELEAPANPLICPQFCLRFNDLDNIGLTGRHYSGFIMLGIQVFNKPDEYKFFKEQCVEFNYRWLTEQLKIDPEEITFVEDVWAGGGNLGPSIEYFIGGLELGNMVFMQYKYNHDATMQELDVKVIDVGIGLERIPWLINGSPTSYIQTFSESFKFLNSRLQIALNNEMWEKMGPYSCHLNIDEVENIEATWEDIAKKVQASVEDVKSGIVTIKDLYVVLDHTRTVLMIISDGGLPSNTGGGSNCRNVLRKVFATLKKNQWWDKLGGMDGLLELFESHKTDLEKIFGKFPEYKSFGDIIKIEYERWHTTEGGQKKKIEAIITKKKGKLSLDDWIDIMGTHGTPADLIAQVAKCQIPGNLYNQIANRAEKVAKATDAILYDTFHFPETENLYYIDHRMYKFDGKVVGVLDNVQNKEKGKNIVLLDRSAFYPTSGGQVHDTGKLKIGEQQYTVVSVDKVGKCFLHFLDRAVDSDKVMGQQAVGQINEERRSILRSFHTGTHIIFAAARRVLGPHIWQNGAKKTEQYAHLDITHYESITQEIQMAIENEANKIILEGHKINKYFENKSQAEKKHGFHLYQGGIVPGNVIRVVNIDGVDVEACCGTHADNTSQVGWIKMIKSTRVSDGILRLYYMAGKKVMKALNEETVVINELKKSWKVKLEDIVPTGNRFFNDSKKYEKEAQNQKLALLSMQVRYMSESKLDKYVLPTLEKEPKLYFSSVNTHLVPIVCQSKSVIFLNDSLIFGIISKQEHVDLDKLLDMLAEEEKSPQQFKKKLVLKKGLQVSKGKQKIKNEKGIQFNYNGKIKEKKIMEFLQNGKFELLK